MNPILITILAGICIFLAVYFGFEILQERVWSKMVKVCEEVAQIRRDLFLEKDLALVTRDHVIVSGIAASIFLFLLWPSFGIALPFCMIIFRLTWNLPLYYYKYFIRSRRVTQFSFQMVDALTLMANGLKSGLNIPQTLQIVVDEMPNPIKQEFGLVLSENRVGISIEAAFENLGRRIPSEDVSMFVTSVNILSETGGNIAETFQNITKTIRERLKLQSKIQAMTAQGMTSAVIVGALPWVLGIILYFIDPVQMKPMFTNPVGWLILLVITILEAIGFVVILKIVKIKV